MATTIDGRKMAEALRERAIGRVATLRATGVTPTLAVILVGTDPASEIYVGRKIAECRRVGVVSREYRLPATTTGDALIALVESLNSDASVDGILVQLPLPNGISSTTLLDRIAPHKDVDGFHPVNVGRLSTGTGGLVPCTPLGIMKMLDAHVDDFRGLRATVIGKSNIVGKPVAMLLLEREATVTVTHIETVDLPAIVYQSDIVVAAAGVPHLVRGDWIKPGAIVIDVGINRLSDAHGKVRIVGDCAIDELAHAKAISPVPGGVGPMTIACLLENTISASERRANTLHIPVHLSSRTAPVSV